MTRDERVQAIVEANAEGSEASEIRRELQVALQAGATLAPGEQLAPAPLRTAAATPATVSDDPKPCSFLDALEAIVPRKAFLHSPFWILRSSPFPLLDPGLDPFPPFRSCHTSIPPPLPPFGFCGAPHSPFWISGRPPFPLLTWLQKCLSGDDRGRTGRPPARPGARAGRTGAPARPAPRRRHAGTRSNQRRDTGADGSARQVGGTRRFPISPLIDTYLVPATAPRGARSARYRHTAHHRP